MWLSRFIAGHPNSDLRRHLDSVPPETPIGDIVDRCRVWDIHADTDDRRVVKPMLERAQPVYAVSESTLGPTEQVVAAITGPSVGLADLETVLRDWTAVLCFSCGNYGYGVSRCPTLDVKCPYMLPRWSAEKRGDHYMMISLRLTAERLRAGNGD